MYNIGVRVVTMCMKVKEYDNIEMSDFNVNLPGSEVSRMKKLFS
jgi:hypothetical protein